MAEAVIIDAVRTAFGRRGGALRGDRPDTLLAFALRQLAERSALDPQRLDDVIAGCVVQAGEQAANIGRLAVLLAGFPVRVPAVSLNRMCGSSAQAVHFAAQACAAGDADFVVACGVESMSRVPMFLDVTLGRDEFRGFEGLNPLLFEQHELVHQIESAERLAGHWGLTREELDDYARESHRRAQAAADAGLHREILVTPGLDGDEYPIELTRDEGIRPLWDAARAGALLPVMRAPGHGVITAANASQMADGAAAVLVAERTAAEAAGLQPRACFRARVVVGSDPTMQLDGVIPATHLALQRAGLALADMDWIEINEAFASVVLAWARALRPDLARVNPWGGAIAHGHPLGATGAGLLAKMLAGLEATGGQFGLLTLCIGHGMAIATVIERL
ncbi:MAG: thiolase family protein [Betaproteobacteria bacterium]|nr:thiolase family protein [Betaproteobacteria bacterium]